MAENLERWNAVRSVERTLANRSGQRELCRGAMLWLAGQTLVRIAYQDQEEEHSGCGLHGLVFSRREFLLFVI